MSKIGFPSGGRPSLSPTADGINRAIETNELPVEIAGTTSSAFLAWTLSQNPSITRPQLVVCHSEKSAERFREDLLSFTPTASVCMFREFDESPYSGLYPGTNVFNSRMKFLWKALGAKKTDVFVTSLEALLQRTLPKELFIDSTLTLKTGDEIDLGLLMKQLSDSGYSSVPIVEDYGTFSRRGDIFDVYSPVYDQPVRIELFGDQIESIRLFDENTQLSIETQDKLTEVELVPARELIPNSENLERALDRIKLFCDENEIRKETRENLLGPLRQKILPHGIDFWFSYFYETTSSALDYFAQKPLIYFLDSLEITRAADNMSRQFKEDFEDEIKKGAPCPPPSSIYDDFETIRKNSSPELVDLQNIEILEDAHAFRTLIKTKNYDTSDFRTVVQATREAKKDFLIPAVEKIEQWRKDNLSCFLFASTQTQAQRIQYLLESHGLVSKLTGNQEAKWNDWVSEQKHNPRLIHVLPRPLSEGCRMASEGVVFLRDEDLFGTKIKKDHRKTKGTLEQRTNALSFGDLNPNDLIVHTQHGVGIYEGLKKMTVQNIDAEYIQLKYKDGDKLYLPVYRISQIQKYSSPGGYAQVDKLGSTSWQKAKIKVRSELKDVAAGLLELYAKRVAASGFAFSPIDDDFREFEATFPYDETPDQLKAIQDVIGDMEQARPMDRLVCGDVGFGKTEVAIRAAFKCVQDKKQVAVLVPTTVLAFQHFNTFTKRLKDFAVNVAIISRFNTAAAVKKSLLALKEGKVDIIIGTHRLLSKDVVFKDLGLLVVDEEQKFGVTHKERIKKLKSQVDVLTLSATPIPRTLNMGLMGVRDLSLINTPPEDRLSIRTFISRFDEEIIRKAIMGEIARGGQVFFIHNRVQSINDFAARIKALVPEARIRIGHGQMADDELEKTMLDFYNHEFDVLLSTTIIESGLDIALANTLIVDRADTFGLSQLYQLRGRVGRSKERAYAYLLIPSTGVVEKVAAERLKILQEHSELGSGFQIAHHDLELRGSGNLLGEDQSGHIAAVGYELYMELLEQTLQEAKGEFIEDDLEPDINIRIPALIPDSYIEDIRIRLSYYKALTDIEDESDLDRMESELVDRFGPLPEQVANLFGLMLIRRVCKDLGVKDITTGPKNLSLVFAPSTKVKPEAVIRLAMIDQKKYQLTPDQKLIIRFSSETWTPILEELRHLKYTLL